MQLADQLITKVNYKHQTINYNQTKILIEVNKTEIIVFEELKIIVIINIIYLLNDYIVEQNFEEEKGENSVVIKVIKQEKLKVEHVTKEVYEHQIEHVGVTNEHCYNNAN